MNFEYLNQAATQLLVLATINEMEIGFKWNSPEGEREITQKGTHPTTGEDVYLVSTNEGSLLAVIKTRDLEQNIRFDEANYTSRMKTRHLQEEEEKVRAEHDRWYGFTDSMTPVARTKAVQILNKQVSVNHEFAQRGQHIVQRVMAGSLVMDGRDGRRLERPDGAYLMEKDLTKTGIDFAKYLINYILTTKS